MAVQGNSLYVPPVVFGGARRNNSGGRCEREAAGARGDRIIISPFGIRIASCNFLTICLMRILTFWAHRMHWFNVARSDDAAVRRCAEHVPQLGGESPLPTVSSRASQLADPCGPSVQGKTLGLPSSTTMTWWGGCCLSTGGSASVCPHGQKRTSDRLPFLAQAHSATFAC